MSRSSFGLGVCWQNMKREKMLGMTTRGKMFQYKNNAELLSVLHPVIHQVSWKIYSICSRQ